MIIRVTCFTYVAILLMVILFRISFNIDSFIKT